MTVCIAGICRETRLGEQVLVMCTDTRVTIPGFASSDTTSKLEMAGPLSVLIADSAARAKEVVATISEQVQEVAEDSLLGKLKVASKTHKTKLFDEYFGITWGIDYAAYLTGALDHLPGETLSKIVRDVEEVNFECQLIIAARMPTRFRLFTIDAHGIVLEADGFAVIGSGAWIAQASLCQRQYSEFYTLPRAAYLIHEAKKLAENEPSVGAATNMFLHHQKGAIRWLFNGAIWSKDTTGNWVPSQQIFDPWFKLYGPQQIPMDLKLPEGYTFWESQAQKVPSFDKDKQTDISGIAESGGDAKSKEGV